MLDTMLYLICMTGLQHSYVSLILRLWDNFILHIVCLAKRPFSVMESYYIVCYGKRVSFAVMPNGFH